MSRFEDRLERDLGHIADRATPSPIAYEAIQNRIAAQAPESETEIIMLDPDATNTRRFSPWILGAAAAILVAVGVIGLTRSSENSSVHVTDTDPIDAVTTTTSIATTTAPAEPVAAADAVTIEGVIDVDLVDGELIVGTGSGSFEVTVGAEALGCAGGTVEETYAFQNAVTKVMTCTSGAKTGTFTIGAGDGHDGSGGWWDIIDATGDFVGLTGTGSWDGREIYLDETSFGNPIYVFVQESQYTETLSGSIEIVGP